MTIVLVAAPSHKANRAVPRVAGRPVLKADLWFRFFSTLTIEWIEDFSNTSPYVAVGAAGA